MGSSMSRVAGLARIPGQAAQEQNWGQRMASWQAECSSLQDFAAAAALEPGELSLVKLDVEGAEAQLLPQLVAWLGGGGGAGGAGGGPTRPCLLVELHPNFWLEPARDHAAVAGALSTWKFIYASPPRTQRQGNLRPVDFLPLDPLAALSASGQVCAEDYCVVLACDEPFDWSAQ
jgi:hypothetical protein